MHTSYNKVPSSDLSFRVKESVTYSVTNLQFLYVAVTDYRLDLSYAQTKHIEI